MQRLERLPTPKIGREEAMKLAEEKVGGTATNALLAVVEKTPAWMVTVTMKEGIYAYVYVDPENGEILKIEVLP
ncbi:MAG: PepSY domain-containing protein [Candidatus Bathyarchaeia archaeon]